MLSVLRPKDRDAPQVCRQWLTSGGCRRSRCKLLHSSDQAPEVTGQKLPAAGSAEDVASFIVDMMKVKTGFVLCLA